MFELAIYCVGFVITGVLFKKWHGDDYMLMAMILFACAFWPLALPMLIMMKIVNWIEK